MRPTYQCTSDWSTVAPWGHCRRVRRWQRRALCCFLPLDLPHFAFGDPMVLSHLRAVALLVSMSGVAVAQEPRTGPASSASAKPALTEAEFARIEQLGAVALSPDGKWVAYDFRRGASGPTELRYRAVSGGEESAVPLGNGP